jgi:hypothetical protein
MDQAFKAVHGIMTFEEERERERERRTNKRVRYGKYCARDKEE